ncbi:MAG: phosphatase PAP2 family protein [Bryobacteraceae bacterium]
MAAALLSIDSGWSQSLLNEGPQASSQPAQAPPPVQADRRDPNLYGSQQRSSRSFTKKFATNVFLDQKDIWTSPFRMNKSSAKWWVLAGVTTAALIAADHPVAQALPQTGTTVDFGTVASRLGQWYTVFPVAGAFYASGVAMHNEKLLKTGALSLQALVGAEVVTNVLKVAARRERPQEGDGGGHFGVGGTSFPSGHSSQAWALATVVAAEYGDHKWVPYASYGYAALISTSRMLAQKHFSSDVFVGGALGFFVGRYVVRTDNAHRSHVNTGHSRLLSPTVLPSFSPFQKSVTVTWTN